MKISKKITVGLGVAAIAASTAVAGPIPGTPTVGSMGESFWGSNNSPSDPGLNIDWMVLDATSWGYAGAYVYLYQIEVKTSATDVKSFNVSFNQTASPILASGYLNSDLDVALGGGTPHPAHAVAGEMDSGFLAPAFTVDSAAVINATQITSGGISWNFTGIASPGTGATPYQESGTFYFVTKNPPIYGNGNALDSIPPSPWSGGLNPTTPSSQPIPVPAVPEPSEYLMAGIGLLGLGYLIRRKKLVAA